MHSKLYWRTVKSKLLLMSWHYWNAMIDRQFNETRYTGSDYTADIGVPLVKFFRGHRQIWGSKKLILGRSKLWPYFLRLWTKVHQVRCPTVHILEWSRFAVPFFDRRYLIPIRRYSRSSCEVVRNRTKILSTWQSSVTFGPEISEMRLQWQYEIWNQF